MTRGITYPNPIKPIRRNHYRLLNAIIASLLTLLSYHRVTAQAGPSIPLQYSTNPGLDTSLYGNETIGDYDEVQVTLYVPRVGSAELQAIVYGDQLYIPITDFFDFLKIRNYPSPDVDLVQGFISDPNNSYTIDKTNNRIVYQYKSYKLKPNDLIRTQSNLYLKSDYFGLVFGLECVFDFRSLSVTLNTKIELPAIREMQQDLMRRNMSRLKGEKKADTTIGRSFPFLHFGTADWAVVSSQETKGITDTRLNLGLGGIIAGGELNLSMNYFSRIPLKLRQQFYQWRLVNNDSKVLRQVTAGKLFVQSTASIFAPVVGVQVTNTPSTFRKSFGTFTVSNTTEPGWIVELYVNNVLVNYVKADASGFYTFEVPMVYGNSSVKLRFYGPWGEEQMSEKYITVPFNFVPVRQFEYTVSAGIVEDIEHAKYTRANFNYGLSRHLTVGGGVEYLSSVTSGKSMPFVQASLVLGSKWLVSAEHTYGVRSKLAVNYRLPSNLQVDASYIKYAPGQTAIWLNYTEEKKLVVSIPWRNGKVNTFSRLTVNQFTYPFNDLSAVKTTSKYTSAEYLFSATMSGVTTNLTTYALLNKEKTPLVYSNLSFSLRLPKGIRFSPQCQYEYRLKKFSMLKAEIEKNLFARGFLNVSYQADLINKKYSVLTVGLRYNFSFAQTFLAISRNDKSTVATQSARGSVLYNKKTNYLHLSDQSQIGKGGIIVLPYLDMNGNGRHDAHEPKAAGLKVRINGGRIDHNNTDTIIRISGLEGYANYYLELETSGFDNVAWQIAKPTIKVVIDPNFFKLIEVPVAVVGEVSGSVSLQKEQLSGGLGRVIVNIYNDKAILVTRILTEADGFFSYVGLAPGDYTAGIDTVQLSKLGMKASKVLSFKIKENINGDVVGDLRFVLLKVD